MKDGLGFLGALVIAVGLGLGGWFVGDGFFKGRAAERYVTVKGVSERDVKADIGLWPIRFVSTHDDLSQAQTRIAESKQIILDFLKSHGIHEDAVALQKLSVTDVLANPYRSGSTQSRYIISQTLMVRTNNPTPIQKASQHVGDLVKAGVVLSSQGGTDSVPTYLFTQLSRLKPEMIAEATANARRAAARFAEDSGSRIGKIRRARQGVFVILPRDRAPGIMEGTQLEKTLRVVSTLQYYLKD
ncbi:MAG: SIMPL domain-containing protein [Deltaproteobacteria bacterium]|nr:SIMPL domain-containing protein [Deltaproteobacteria bacterium]MCF8119483.1 SIMPL domain-containing protein [Deltaproteobacteria bacterium]